MANPSEPPDHYATLGIPPTASLPDIRRAYHAQALLHHPDRNCDQTAVATERFQQIALAWQTLSSASSKRDYDLSRSSSSPPSPSAPSPSDPPTPSSSSNPRPPSNPHTRLCLLRAQLSRLDALDAQHARARELRAAAAAPSWPWKWRSAPATEEEEARMEEERLERAAVRRVKLAEVEELERVVGRERERDRKEKKQKKQKKEKGVREKEEERKRNNKAAFVAFAVFTLGNLVIIARRTSAVAGVR